jgi:two-component system response regulator
MQMNEVEILLIEDNMNDAEMTIRSLTKNNILNPLMHVKDGEEAIDFLFGTGSYSDRDTSVQPHLILLDLKMPKVNGIDVLKKLKASELTRRIPVVVLTSSNENPDIKECYALGANSYIVKPVDFDSFSRSISQLGFYWILLNQKPV